MGYKQQLGLTLWVLCSVVWGKQNCYQKLRVSTSASETEIKQAFRKAARKYHPDKVDADKKDAAEAKFKELARCYEILKDPEAKQMYDSSGYNENFDQMGGPGGGPGGGHHFHFQSDNANFDFSDLFSSFFGGGGGRSGHHSDPLRGGRGGNRRRRAHPGAGGMPGFGGGMGGGGAFPGSQFRGDPQAYPPGYGQNGAAVAKKKTISVSVTLEDLLEDSTKSVSLSKGKRSRGGRNPEISVDIKAGAIDGSKLKVSADSFSGDAQMADQYDFTLKIKKHKYFERRKGKLQSDLYYRLPLTLNQAINGGTFKVPTIDGGSHEITVDYATPDSTVKIKQLGMPRLSGSKKRGSMIVEFDIKFPKHLTDHDKEQFNSISSKWVYPIISKPKKQRQDKSEL